MTFSVVIAAFNTAATVEEAVVSAASQTLRPVEILVVDDGSTDLTPEILERSQRRLKCLRVLRHPGGANRGVAVSRNLGVSLAHGDTMVFLDADDVLFPDALAAYADGFGRFPNAGLIYGLAETFGDGLPARLIGRGEQANPAGMLRQFARFNVTAASAVAVRRNALGTQPFPPGLPFQFEDWACWLRVARSWPVVYLPRLMCRYRIHAGSFLAGLERGCRMAAFEAAQADFLRAELGEASAAERRALAQALTLRAAAALLRGTSAVRRGRPREARQWFVAARRIAGGWAALVAVLPFAAQERRRIARGLDPPLSPDPAPEPPQVGVHAG